MKRAFQSKCFDKPLPPLLKSPAQRGVDLVSKKRLTLRKLVAYTSLAIILLWLFLSYLPASLVSLPILAFPDALNLSFQQILIAGTVIFLGLQVWILITTMGIFRSGQPSRAIAQAFNLSPGREFVWTALPILMTLLLAAAARQTWLSLTLP
jgi:nitric oxide reductase large subunit